MKSFMSATLQNTAPSGSAERNQNDSGAVPTAGKESADAAAQLKNAATTDVAAKPEGAVVVMQGPLGSAITEALNKSLSKKAAVSAVQVPTAATESYSSEYVQANGQIRDSSTFISKISKAVGLVPATDNESTAINTLLDCASKVDDIDFIMVGKVDSDPSTPFMPQKSIIHAVNSDGCPAMEEIAIESVQVVVTYHRRPKE
jgi:hypothetical protein